MSTDGRRRPRLPPALRTEALESLLRRARPGRPRGRWTRSSRTYENDVGPMNGAKVVAKAWTDPEYKRAAAGRRHRRHRRAGLQGPAGRAHRGRREHRRRSTTSSSARCAPATRGRCSACRRPGTRTRPTASRMVREPRAVLAEMGLELGRRRRGRRCCDSSSEVRYLVLPERPAGTDGLSEEELAALVTRDAMVGVAKVAAPCVTRPPLLDVDGPGRAAAAQRRAGLRRAVGEPGVRAGHGAGRRAARSRGTSFRDGADRADRGLGGRARAGRALQLLPLLAAAPWRTGWSRRARWSAPARSARAVRALAARPAGHDHADGGRRARPRSRALRSASTGRPARCRRRPPPRRSPGCARSVRRGTASR